MTELAGTGTLLRLAWRRDRWVVIVCVLAIVLLAYGSMAATLTLYPTDADAAAAAAVLGATSSVKAMYGPLPALTAEGVGVIKTITMGGLGAAFLAYALVRRHTRTEEEEGRLELVAAGVVGRRAPLAAAVTIAVAATLATGLLSAVSLMALGVSATGSLALGVVIAVAGLVMAGVTAVAAQLTTTTRGAGGIALAVLCVTFLIRAVADTSGASWLVWLSFLGWAEKVSPFGADRLWILVPALGALALLLLAADRLLHRRDLGSGLWADRPGPASAAPRLGTPLGLAWRLQRGALLGWAIGYAVLGLVIGSLAGSAGQIASDPNTAAMLRKMSGGQGSLTDVFFGTELRFAALGAAAYGIASALRLRSEEAAGRAELVLSTATDRLRWLASHVVVALGGATLLMAVVGAGAGIGASTSAVIGIGALLAAALSTLPAVWVCTAVAVFLFGLLPRRAVLAWAVLAAFLLLGELGPLLGLPDAVQKASPFAHLGSLPGGSADLGGALVLVLVAAALTAYGVRSFRRRDLMT